VGADGLQTYIVGDVSTVAGLALAAVGLVWLIACANASNLLIARVTGRRRELAVRAALGASRGRVVRYLLAESALLALGAGALGIGLASIGTRLWRDLAVDYFPRAREIALDGPALAVLAALTGISILLFGLVPAAHGSGGSLGLAGGKADDPLRSMGRAATASTAVRRLRRVLVGSQFAIATPLLVVAGLFLATLSELGRVDLGFDTHNLASGSITLPAPQYGEAGRARAFWTEVRRRVEAVPGVSAVGVRRRPARRTTSATSTTSISRICRPAGTVAAGHAVGCRLARIFPAPRSVAARRPAARRARRSRRRPPRGGRRSRVGEALLSQSKCDWQTVPLRRLHDLSVDVRRRRRQRSEIRRAGQARPGQRLHGAAAG
jgi:hypothetical protein